MLDGLTSSRCLYIVLGIIGLFGVVTFILAAATLGTVNKRIDAVERNLLLAITTTPSPESVLSTSINFDEVFQHLKQLQNISDMSNGTRAVNTPGFDRTLDYITQILNANNYNVNKTFFLVKDFALASTPILSSTINGVPKNYTYSSDPAIADFLHVRYSINSSFTNAFPITVVPNGGCTSTDWDSASTATNGKIALVKRGGNCAFSVRAAQTFGRNVAGIIFYNDGTLPDRFSPIEISLAQNNTLPALFMSYQAGETLANAARNASNIVTVQLGIELRAPANFSVSNICADTPTGDATQTIVVGSHSDSVQAGSGINDNGSGSAANLGLAVALARLYQTSYTKYKYRVRFCWWGAEEIGLLGSIDHVNKAKNSTIAGERLQDYLINLNYDMLGSPNYIFGIYDGKTATNGTPINALPGSNKVTDLFKNWFERQNLPWDSSTFDGRSDYGPFLEGGIAAGGLFTGADGTKTAEQQLRYARILGQGMGGIAGATYDPCYHKACDSIQNINKFAFEKMIRAAAYVLEYLARQDDLKTWLYPPISG